MVLRMGVAALMRRRAASIKRTEGRGRCETERRKRRTRHFAICRGQIAMCLRRGARCLPGKAPVAHFGTERAEPATRGRGRGWFCLPLVNISRGYGGRAPDRRLPPGRGPPEGAPPPQKERRMDRFDDSPEQALAFHRAGKGAALATVVETWGSAPRRTGAMLAVSGEGDLVGSVSGGCVEGAVVTEAIEAIGDGRSRVLTFGVSDDDAFAVGLACGGTIRILVEPVGGAGGMPVALLEALCAARGRAREGGLCGRYRKLEPVARRSRRLRGTVPGGPLGLRGGRADLRRDPQPAAQADLRGRGAYRAGAFADGADRGLRSGGDRPAAGLRRRAPLPGRGHPARPIRTRCWPIWASTAGRRWCC
jgi:hypothetical protein